MGRSRRHGDAGLGSTGNRNLGVAPGSSRKARTGFEILEDRRHRHARALEEPGAADLSRDLLHDRALRPVENSQDCLPIQLTPDAASLGGVFAGIAIGLDPGSLRPLQIRVSSRSSASPGLGMDRSGHFLLACAALATDRTGTSNGATLAIAAKAVRITGESPIKLSRPGARCSPLRGGRRVALGWTAPVKKANGVTNLPLVG